METAFNNLQNIQRLRYEAFSKFATNLNLCKDYDSIGSILAGQVKFILDTFVFRVYFKFDKTHITFTIFRGNCTLLINCDDQISAFDQSIVMSRLPSVFSSDQIKGITSLHETLYTNPQIRKLAVLPGQNIEYSVLLCNAVRSDINESDFKFLKLIGDILGSKLHQLCLIEKLEKNKRQLELKNIEITDLNLTLEKKVDRRTHELKQANWELQRLFYSATHDFRTPLTNILGLANVGEVITTDKEILQLFDGCRQSVLRLDRTLHKLNSMSFFEGFSEDLELIRFADIIYEVKQNLGEKISSKNASFNLLGDENQVVLSHRRMLISIFENIIENAIVFCEGNPEINIHIISSCPDFEVHVSDNGVGIPGNISSNIFEMFYRGSELSKGSGLGLFVVKKLLKNLDGEITFESPPGLGTVFKITLPGDPESGLLMRNKNFNKENHDYLASYSD